MDISEGKKVNIVDYYTMRELTEGLVAKGIITQEIMDTTMERIARENSLLDALHGSPSHRQDSESSARTITILPTDPKADTPCVPDHKKSGMLILSEQPMSEYMSFTELVRSHHMENPSYVIQSWVRSENTLAFLDLWEQENNPAYDKSAYAALLEKKKSTSFTVTAKQWIEQTKAIGITSKQGKQGGTFAHPMIACEFATWLSPKYMMRLIKMSQFGEDLFQTEI